MTNILNQYIYLHYENFKINFLFPSSLIFYLLCFFGSFLTCSSSMFWWSKNWRYNNTEKITYNYLIFIQKLISYSFLYLLSFEVSRIYPVFYPFLSSFLYQGSPNTQVLNDSYCSRLIFPHLLSMFRLPLIDDGNKITGYHYVLDDVRYIYQGLHHILLLTEQH